MKPFGTALRMLLIMTIITGIAYPLLITAVGQLFFPGRANGSLIEIDGKTVGSALIAQKFTGDQYFWPRPSAVDYNPMPSSGSNIGPSSAVLRDSVAARITALKKSTDSVNAIPPDLLFASGSGLDPHISPEAAQFQLARVASARHFDQAKVGAAQNLIAKYTEMPTIGIFGQRRVNVLRLNLALDSIGRM
jgi:potassium-transporting ATPase KdpC subunit